MARQKIPTLEEVVGSNLRRLQVEGDTTQDELARRVRAYGLSWSRSTVAALEAGTKTLDVGELVCLGLAVAPVTKLLAGEGPVRLGNMVTDLDTARRVLAGKTAHLLSAEEAAHLVRGFSRLPGAQVIADVPFGEAEQKAARNLRVDVEDLAKAALRVFGRSLTDERDARVAEAAQPGTNPRSRQALRGHITRQLLKELEPALVKPKRQASTRTRTRRRS